MGYEIDAFPSEVLDTGVTERAFPDYSSINIGDDKSIKRRHHSRVKLRVFVGCESQRKVVLRSADDR
jgi:hypothetical protein